MQKSSQNDSILIKLHFLRFLFFVAKKVYVIFMEGFLCLGMF